MRTLLFLRLPSSVLAEATSNTMGGVQLSSQVTCYVSTSQWSTRQRNTMALGMTGLHCMRVYGGRLHVHTCRGVIGC